MNTCSKIVLALVATMVGFGGGSPAAPSLPVTKIPVTPAISYTGPTNDSHAIMGQWFKSATNSDVSYRTHEFYDNPEAAGGGTAGSLAIEGQVTNITYDIRFTGQTNGIKSFDVVATIRHDAATPSAPWAAGSNVFDECLAGGASYSNTLTSIILAVDFSAAGILSTSMGSFPYRDSTNSTYITALNHDVTSWYGSHFLLNQDGNYYVPGWDFWTLQPGQFATRICQFAIRNSEGGDTYIPPSDPRYAILVESETQGKDIFINRSTSLKINRWIGDPATDSGTHYPVDLEGADASNVSVFHNTIDDDTQSVAICQIRASTNGASVLLESTGSMGIRDQILQTCTDLSITNWMPVLTNQAWPIPQTNHWIDASASAPVRFYRIIQP